MKLLIVLSLLFSVAFADITKNQAVDLLDKLDDLLLEAYKKNNLRAIEAVEDAVDTVTYALGHLKSSNEDQSLYFGALSDVADELQVIEKMVQSDIKSRNWFGDAFKFVKSKLGMVASVVQKTFGRVQESGFSGLMSIIEPYIEKIRSNPQLKGVVAGLHIVEQGIDSLNKMTGGAIGPLNTISDVLNNIDATGQLFNSMISSNSSDALVDALVNTLVNARSGNVQKLENALEYVCNSIEDFESSTDKSSQ